MRTQKLLLKAGVWATLLGPAVAAAQVPGGTMPTTPGSTTPGTTTPGTAVPSTTPRSTLPGTTTPGTTAPRGTMPGNSTPGSTVPGTTVPGISTPGTVAPGATVPGTSTPGTIVPGSAVPGITTPGTVAPGATGTPGTGTLGAARPGATAPGATGTPGAVVPGTSAPGATGAPGANTPGATVPGATGTPGAVVPGTGGTAVPRGTVRPRANIPSGAVAPPNPVPRPKLPVPARAVAPAPPVPVQQARTTAPVDTGRVFSLQDLAELVFANHPIVKQAGLLSERARGQVLQARGGFDPKATSGFDRKIFGGTDYYNKWANEFKVPIWLGGIDLKAGYDRYVGTYVNPETRTPQDGLAGIGLSVPLGQGLLIDARRSTLRQARIMVNAAEADRVKQINDVWLQAAKDYWNWYYTYQQAILIQEGVDLAETRFRAISQRVDLGDQAPIDSVEARITAQDRLVQGQQLAVDLQNARLLLSNHLWNKDNQPVELPPDAIPQPARIDSVSRQEFVRLREQAATQHPTLRKLDAKILQLGVEERYRRELLKPTLNVTGTLLSRGDFYRPEVPASYDFGLNNYKVGVDFALPIFLRQARGQLQVARLNVRENVLELQQSRRTIDNRVAATYYTLKAYESQLAVQTLTIANQRLLLAAELQKYELGESTIFLINARESKLIDLRIKQESLRASYEKAVAELYYYAGTRSVNVE